MELKSQKGSLLQFVKANRAFTMKPLLCKERDKWMYSFGFDVKIHKAVTKYMASFFLEGRLLQILFKKIMAYQEKS